MTTTTQHGDETMMTATATTTRTIIRPTTTGRTEAKPVARKSKPKLNWFERGMTLGDLVGTANNRKFDDLANRLAGK